MAQLEYNRRTMAVVKTFTTCLKLLPVFARLGRLARYHDPLVVHRLPELGEQPVDRDSFVAGICKGRRVLHFGFVDSPFSAARIKAGALLHQRLASVATFLFGLDLDEASIEQYRALTGDRNNEALDIQKPLSPAPFLAQSYDVLVFGEILEHLLHPAAAMANLNAICRLNPGARVCITVPNALAVSGFFTALFGIELVHPDHYFYFSPITLRKLLRDTGFEVVEMHLYTDHASRSCPGLTKNGVIAVCKPAG
jgi:Methyltransferase domain